MKIAGVTSEERLIVTVLRLETPGYGKHESLRLLNYLPI
jgi:hypothetical protein